MSDNKSKPSNQRQRDSVQNKGLDGIERLQNQQTPKSGGEKPSGRGSGDPRGVDRKK